MSHSETCKLLVGLPVGKLDISRYRSDPAFDYSRGKPPEDYFERFINWLFQLLFNHSIGSRGMADIWIFIIFCCVSLILYVVIRLLGVDVFRLFSRNSATFNEPGRQLQPDIHAIDFTQSINKAIAMKDYRAAIRFRYLQTLKQLSDYQLISWSKEKTNLNYFHELARPSLKAGFARITYSYEYVFYGHFNVDEAGYQAISGEFAAFTSSLRQ